MRNLALEFARYKEYLLSQGYKISATGAYASKEVKGGAWGGKGGYTISVGYTLLDDSRYYSFALTLDAKGTQVSFQPPTDPPVQNLMILLKTLEESFLLLLSLA